MKILRLFFLLTCLVGLSLASFGEQGPSLGAPGAILIDAQEGTVLFEKNADTLMYPASTTKILTALIILEDLPLDEKVTVMTEAIPAKGSHIALEPGEVFTVGDLLYGLMVQSANDAAQVLAIHHSGSLEAFSQVMNERARALGSTNSQFMNPSGLHHEQHVSTARDLALISRAAYEHPIFRELATTPSYEMPVTAQKGEPRYLHSNNAFIRDTGKSIVYRGQDRSLYEVPIDGIKTGYTPEANNCFVSTMKQGDMRLIGVTLGASTSHYEDILTLLDYGFEAFRREVLIEKDTLVDSVLLDDLESTRIDVYPVRTTALLIEKDLSLEAVERSMLLKNDLSLPISPGEEVGTLRFSSGEKTLATVPLTVKTAYGDGVFVSEQTRYLLADEPFYKRILTPAVRSLLFKLLSTLLLWRFLVAFFASRRKSRPPKKKSSKSQGT